MASIPAADTDSVFIKACRRQEVPHTPVWVMRQAGRYLPEYRELRSRVDFVTLTRSAELAAEVTLQPVRRFPLDAAILFSDIMTPLQGMGIPLTFEPGPGGRHPDPHPGRRCRRCRPVSGARCALCAGCGEAGARQCAARRAADRLRRRARSRCCATWSAASPRRNSASPAASSTTSPRRRRC